MVRVPSVDLSGDMVRSVGAERRRGAQRGSDVERRCGAQVRSVGVERGRGAQRQSVGVEHRRGGAGP